jgi:hypothetical protein
MEKTIKSEIKHKYHDTKIQVNNSGKPKEFMIELTRGGRIHSLYIKNYTEDDVEVLEMDSVILKGRELQMFREFLNQ